MAVVVTVAGSRSPEDAPTVVEAAAVADAAVDGDSGICALFVVKMRRARVRSRGPGQREPTVGVSHEKVKLICKGSGGIAHCTGSRRANDESPTVIKQVFQKTVRCPSDGQPVAKRMRRP